MPLSTVIVPYVTDNLNEKSRPFFQSDREKKFGKTMEELKTNLEERQMNWEKFKDGMGRIDGWFTKNDEEGLFKSDFIMGDQPVFADFVIGGLLAWIRNVWGEDSAEWNEMKGWHDGRWLRLVDQLRKYETVH
ncbi:hypothetical protein CC1G_05384 [Coprinopsis cinerea okayama7|uniref:Glutathione S-transferase UstS-like C-terminal domain-containing protein n=1 Tax=Coprinopsis cinerea (strain Okayama-7 / 130 / ATCC MYA-4618 / FGSC 9003) TaxID=240176 RepID=A8NPW8_COPC7|nr:hypothetical protein CC1G_05384 [Coprinopsis cinerea okayama7\|eukprot:XP_001835422.2 hypothetical protein CC1G_05384 [Coprinopsis cinerea okayama7\